MAPGIGEAVAVLLLGAGRNLEYRHLPGMVEVVLHHAVEQKVERVVAAGDGVAEPLVRKIRE